MTDEQAVRLILIQAHLLVSIGRAITEGTPEQRMAAIMDYLDLASDFGRIADGVRRAVGGDPSRN